MSAASAAMEVDGGDFEEEDDCVITKVSQMAPTGGNFEYRQSPTAYPLPDEESSRWGNGWSNVVDKKLAVCPPEEQIKVRNSDTKMIRFA